MNAGRWRSMKTISSIVPTLFVQAANAQQAAASGGGGPADPGFWARYGDKILVAVVTALIVLVFSETIKALLRRFGAWIEKRLASVGWRFEKRYLKALADQHRWLRLIGMYGRADLHPPRLREVYVSLRLAAGRGKEGSRLHWHQVLSEKNARVVILGPPGSGKSTLLSYQVLVLAGVVPHRLRGHLRRPLPLFGRLRELGSEGGPATILELMGRSSGLTSRPRGYFERRLKNGGCVVLLDGLDEVLDEDRQEKVKQQINGLVAEYPDNSFVVTCRVAGWRQQLAGYRTYEIERLADDDIHQFIGAWYREVLRREQVNLLGPAPDIDEVKRAEERAFAEAMERGESLWQALRDNEGLFRIARTPLILSLITLVHFYRVTDLPKGRATLYRQCLEILLDLWDRQDKRLRLAGPSLKEKVLVLGAIAFHFLQNDLLEAEKATVEQLVEPLLPQLQAEITASDLVDQIWKRSGVLVETAIGRYGFAHRALLDFLAADFLVEHEHDELLLEHVAEERWREVILIGIGRVPAGRAQSLVRALLDREGADSADLEIACLSAGEDVQLGDDLCTEIRHRLLTQLSAEQSTAGFGRLVTALMVADLDRAQQCMGEVLRGSDPGLRARVLGMLPWLGERHGKALLPLLVRLVSAADEPVQVRTGAAVALAAMRVEPGADVLRSLAAARRDPNLDVRRAATWAWCELGRFEELGLVKVPAGEFVMGSERGHFREQPRHQLYLAGYYIARFPVTVAQYQGFVDQSGHEVEHRGALRGVDDHPVVWVSWHDARAFAEWYGFSLPSEAEWEKAARGTEGLAYPWGDEWRDGLANTRELWQKGRAINKIFQPMRRGSGSTTPVGQLSPGGDSRYGCADMAGNVWEWTRSLWGEDWDEPEFEYPYNPADGREDEDAPPAVLRVLRGGSFFRSRSYASCVARDGADPGDRGGSFGLRVAVLFSLTSEASASASVPGP